MSAHGRAGDTQLFHGKGNNILGVLCQVLDNKGLYFFG
jgi:hypothetical protein